MTRTKTLRCGTWAEGTVRACDWIDGMRWDLERVRMSRKDRTAVSALYREYDALDPSDIMDELIRIAEGYLPPYAYIGTLEGDGACFGVWASMPDEGDDVLRVDDTADVPKGFSGEVLHVNDHGNCTLYTATRGRLREVWSVV